jgi:hypothetical protein
MWQVIVAGEVLMHLIIEGFVVVIATIEASLT